MNLLSSRPFFANIIKEKHQFSATLVLTFINNYFLKIFLKRDRRKKYLLKGLEEKKLLFLQNKLSFYLK